MISSSPRCLSLSLLDDCYVPWFLFLLWLSDLCGLDIWQLVWPWSRWESLSELAFWWLDWPLVHQGISVLLTGVACTWMVGVLSGWGRAQPKGLEESGKVWVGQGGGVSGTESRLIAYYFLCAQVEMVYLCVLSVLLKSLVPSCRRVTCLSSYWYFSRFGLTVHL